MYLLIYKVFLDDIEKGSTNETSFKFTDLKPGRHIAGVKAVFKSGETETVYSVPFTVTLGVDIKDNILSDVVLYPNPFTNEINISAQEVIKNVEITNVIGQNCLKYNISDNLTDLQSYCPTVSVPTGELANGIYFVVIESIDGNKRVYKMIKK